MARIVVPECNNLEAVEAFCKTYQLPKISPSKFVLACAQLGLDTDGDVIDSARLPIMRRTMKSLK